MSDSRSGLIRPESLLKDYNAMYFLNVVDDQDLPVPEADQKEEEEDQLDWNVTNVEKYENYAEFDEAAHLEIQKNSYHEIKGEVTKVSKSLKNTFMEYHKEVNKYMNSYASKYDESLANAHNQAFESKDAIPALEQKWVFETIPGREHPERWPEGLDKMVDCLLNMRRLELFTEEPSLHEETIHNLEKFIQQQISLLNKIDNQPLDSDKLLNLESICKGVSQALTCLLILAFHFADFDVFLRVFKILDVEEISEIQQNGDVDNLQSSGRIKLRNSHSKKIIENLLPQIVMPISDYLANILSIKGIPDQPSANPHCTLSAFALPGSILPLESKKNIISLTTDNQYLYLIVASKNGCMLKIGTGEGGTKRGYIYKSRQENLSNIEGFINWVCLGDKLYLSSGASALGRIRVLNKQFCDQGDVELDLVKELRQMDKGLFIDAQSEDLVTASEEVFNKRSNRGMRLVADESGSLYCLVKKIRLSEEPKEPEKEGQKNAAESKAPEQKTIVEAMKERIKLQKEEFTQFATHIQKAHSNLFKKSPNKMPNVVPSPSNPLEPPLPDVPNPDPMTVPAYKDAESLLQQEMVYTENPILKEENRKTSIHEGLESLEQVQPPKSEVTDMTEKIETVETDPSPPQITFSNKKRVLVKKTAEKKELKRPKEIPKELAQTGEKVGGVMEFWLYKYDVNVVKAESGVCLNSNTLIKELYSIMNGLFTMAECSHALSISHDDIEVAVQWLIDEGEDFRNKSTFKQLSKTLLYQCLIEPSSVKDKNNASIKVFPHSLLTENSHLSNFFIQSETLKIGKDLYFSIKPEDEYDLPLDLKNSVESGKDFITPDRTKTILKKMMYAEQGEKIKELMGQNNQSMADLLNHILVESEELEANPVLKKSLSLNPQPVATEAGKENKPLTSGLRGTLICRWQSSNEFEHDTILAYHNSTGRIYHMNISSTKSITKANIRVIQDTISYGNSEIFKTNEHFPSLIQKIFYKNYLETQYNFSAEQAEIKEHFHQFLISETEKLNQVKGFQDLRTYLWKRLILINKSRFSLPWKPYDMAEAIRIRKIEINEDASIDKPKRKKLKSQLNTRLEKIEKLYQKQRTAKFDTTQLSDYFEEIKSKAENKHFFVFEQKKKFAFCASGSNQELEAIWSNLKDNLDASSNSVSISEEFWLTMFKIWATHHSINLDQNLVKEIQDKFFELLERSNCDRLKKILGCIVFSAFSIFLASNDSQYRMFNIALSEIQKGYANTPEQKQRDIQSLMINLNYSALREESYTLIEKLYIVFDQLAGCDQSLPFNFCNSNLFWSTQEYPKKEDLSHLKEIGINKCHLTEEQNLSVLMKMKEVLVLSKCTVQTIIVSKMYFRREINNWILLTKEQAYVKSLKNSTEPEAENAAKILEAKFVEFITRLIQGVDSFADILIKNQVRQPTFDSEIADVCVSFVSIITCYLIEEKNMSGVAKSEATIRTILGSLKKFMSIFKIIESASNVDLNNLVKGSNEGPEWSQSKVIESSHPVGRSEKINLQDIHFPSAIGIKVIIDPRINLDRSQDILTLETWFNNQGSSSSGNQEEYIQDGQAAYVGTNFRISGKPNFTKPIFMIGDTIHVNFSTSHKAHNEYRTLTKWGVKVTIIPIYGFNSSLGNNLQDNKVPSVLHPLIESVVTCLNRLSTTLLSCIEPFLKGKRSSTQEKKMKSFLDWNIIKNGLSSLRIDKFFQNSNVTSNQDLKLAPLVLRGLNKVKLDDSSKGESVCASDFNSLISGNSRAEYENNVLDDKGLNQILNKLQDKSDPIYAVIKFINKCQPVPHLLRAEKMRKSFTNDLQAHWEQSETLIILSLLHHANLLALLLTNQSESGPSPVKEFISDVMQRKTSEFVDMETDDLKDYQAEEPIMPPNVQILISTKQVKDQLNQICMIKNNILNKLVSDVQLEKDLHSQAQDLYELILQKKKDIVDQKVELELKQQLEIIAKLRSELETEDKKLLENQKEATKQLKIENLKKKLASNAPVKKGTKRTEFLNRGKREEDDKKKKNKKKTVATESESTANVDEEKLKNKAEQKKKLELEQKKALVKKTEEELRTEIYTKIDLMVKFSEVLTDTLKEEMRQSIKDRFGGQMESVKKILVGRSLEYISDDPNKCFNNILLHLIPMIEKMETDPSSLQNPYSYIAKMVDERCFFLLKLDTGFKVKASQTEQEVRSNQVKDDTENTNNDNDDLKPKGVARSLSSASDKFTKNKKDIQIKQNRDLLQEWIANYQKWRKTAIMDEHNPASGNCSFFVAISQFLDLYVPINLKFLEKTLLRMAERACFRAIGLNMIKEFFSFSSDTWLNKYITGVFSSSFNGNLFDKIEDLNSDIKQLLLKLAGTNAMYIIEKLLNDIDNLKNISVAKIESYITATSENKQDTRVEDLAEDYFRSVFVSYNELYQLIAGGHFRNQEEWFKQNVKTFRRFIRGTIRISLLCTSIIEMSEITRAMKNIIFFARGIIKTNLLIINELVVDTNLTDILEEYNNILAQELGFNTQSEYYLRIIYQLNDAIKGKRLVFILSRFRDLVFKFKSQRAEKQQEQAGVIKDLIQNILNVLYVCTSPNVIKSASHLLDLVYQTSIDVSSLKTIFKNPIVYYHAQNKQALKTSYKEIGMSASICDKIGLKKKIAVFDFEENDKILDTDIESSPFSLLLEKMGALVSQKNAKTELESDKKVKICQKTSHTRNLWEIVDANEIRVDESYDKEEEASSPQKFEMIDKDLLINSTSAQDQPQQIESANDAKITSNSCPKDSFVLVVHSSKQTNFTNLFQALYYISLNCKLINMPETWEEFLAEKKKEAEEGVPVEKQPPPGSKKDPKEPQEPQVQDDNFTKADSSSSQGYFSIYEQTLMKIPDYNLVNFGDESELPVGWFLNLIGSFGDGFLSNRSGRFASRRAAIKAWQYTNIMQIHNALKAQKDAIPIPDDEVCAESKKEFMEEYTFYYKLIWLVKETIAIIRGLNTYGFALLPLQLLKNKAEEYALIIDLALNGHTNTLQLYCDKKWKYTEAAVSSATAKPSQPNNKKSKKKITKPKKEKVKEEEEKKNDDMENIWGVLDQQDEEVPANPVQVEDIVKTEENKSNVALVQDEPIAPPEQKKPEEPILEQIQAQEPGVKPQEPVPEIPIFRKSAPPAPPVLLNPPDGEPISQMKVSICNFNLYQRLKRLIRRIICLSPSSENFIQELNHTNLIHTSNLSGPCSSFYLRRVSESLRGIYEGSTEGSSYRSHIDLIIQRAISKVENLETLSAKDQNLVFGVLTLLNGWKGSLNTGDTVQRKSNSGTCSKQDFILLQNPHATGQLETSIISKSDPVVSQQTVDFESLAQEVKYLSCILKKVNVKDLLKGLTLCSDKIHSYNENSKIETVKRKEEWEKSRQNQQVLDIAKWEEKCVQVKLDWEQKQLAKIESDKKAAEEEIARKLKEENEKKAKEEANARAAQEESQKKAKEEAEKKAKDEAEKKANPEGENLPVEPKPEADNNPPVENVAVDQIASNVSNSEQQIAEKIEEVAEVTNPAGIQESQPSQPSPPQTESSQEQPTVSNLNQSSDQQVVGTIEENKPLEAKIVIPEFPESELPPKPELGSALFEDYKAIDCKYQIRTHHDQKFRYQILTILILGVVHNTGDISSQLSADDIELLKKIAKEEVGSDPELSLIDFNLSWECFVDKLGKLSHMYSIPQVYNQVRVFDKYLKKDFKSNSSNRELESIVREDPGEFILPASSYSEALPRSNPKSLNFKMLTYWEKHIIPQIQNYVRGSFNPFMMADFFEQLRRPLREVDHIKAIKIAYKLCDWHLPPGTEGPSSDYDWNTLTIDEMTAGQMVRVKCLYKGKLVSPALRRDFEIGNQTIVGKILQIEAQSSTVKILYKNQNTMTAVSIWVHQQCILPLNYEATQAEDYPYSYLEDQIDKSYANLTTHISRLIITNNVLPKDGLEKGMRPYEQLKWVIINQFSDNLINGWLQYQSIKSSSSSLVLQDDNKEDSQASANFNSDNKLHVIEQQLSELIQDESQLNSLIEDLKIESQDIVTCLSENNILMNLKENCQDSKDSEAIKSPLNLFHLKANSNDSLCAIAISFKNSAFLGVSSGIKFYSDKKGQRMVNHIFNSMKDKQIKKIAPILLNSTDLYYEFYHYETGANPGLNHLFPSDLPCVVYGIPYSWTSCCWMIDNISVALLNKKDPKHFEKICELVKVSVGLGRNISGPNIIKQMMFKLVIRLLRRLKLFIIANHQALSGIFEKSTTEILRDFYGLDFDFLDSVLNNEALLTPVIGMKTQEMPFYSSYTQDVLEFVSTILTPIETPSGTIRVNYETPLSALAVRRMVDLSNLAEHLLKGSSIKPELRKDILDTLSLKIVQDSSTPHIVQDQKKCFFQVKNLPKNLPVELFKKILKSAILKRKGVLRSQKVDIQMIIQTDKNGLDVVDETCIVFLEGFRPPVTEEDLKNSIEEEDAPPPEPEIPQEWSCPICTFFNPMSEDNCGMCASPKPAEEEEPEQTGADDQAANPESLKDIDLERTKYLGSDIRLAIEEAITSENQKRSQKIEQDLNAYLEDVRSKNAAYRKEQEQKQLKEREKNRSGGRDRSAAAAQPIVEIIDLIQEEEIKTKTAEIKSKLVEIVSGGKVQTSLLFNNGEVSIESDDWLLLRNISEEFEYALNIVLKKEYESNQSALEKIYGKDCLSSVDTFMETFKDTSSWGLYDRLLELGYDFWLSKAGNYQPSSEQQDSYKDMSINELRILIQLIEDEYCNSRSNAAYFSPTLVRVLEKSPILSGPIVEKHSDGTEIKLDENEVVLREYRNAINYESVTNLLIKYQSILDKYDLASIRYNWAKLLKYNEILKYLIPFINMGMENQVYHQNHQLSIGCCVAELREVILIDIKGLMNAEIMKKTALSRETPQITVSRLALTTGKDDDESNTTEPGQYNLAQMKSKYIFLTAFDQIKSIPSTSLRPIQPTGSDAFVAFEVQLKGENVQGQSGPYRQFYADISAELQPSIISSDKAVLNLLIPSPNNKHSIGDFKEKFIINPDCQSQYHLQLFEVLGILMGCSLRTHTHLTLDLPKIFWKTLANQKIIIGDLEEVDKPLVDLMNFIKRCNQDEFEASVFENFESTLSNEKTVELIEGGKDIPVTFERRHEFIDKVIKLRLGESSKQMHSIKRGITQLIPEPFLASMPWRDLEMWICGKNEVDIEMLRRHTTYLNYEESDEVIQNFFTVLHAMKPSDKLRFIKFCWGQVRLPASDEEYEKTQTRLMIKKSTKSGNQDQLFPKADTCFFNLELPEYSSIETMREKILLAINIDSDSMNAEEAFNELENERGNHDDDEDLF